METRSSSLPNTWWTLPNTSSWQSLSNQSEAWHQVLPQSHMWQNLMMLIVLVYPIPITSNNFTLGIPIGSLTTKQAILYQWHPHGSSSCVASGPAHCLLYPQALCVPHILDHPGHAMKLDLNGSSLQHLGGLIMEWLQWRWDWRSPYMVSFLVGEAWVDAVGPELVVHSDDAGETRWYCSEMYLQTGMSIYGNVTWPWIYW